MGNYLLFFRPDIHQKMPKSHSHISHEIAGLEGECKPIEKNAIKLNE
jgi:hypothetical protein